MTGTESIVPNPHLGLWPMKTGVASDGVKRNVGKHLGKNTGVGCHVLLQCMKVWARCFGLCESAIRFTKAVEPTMRCSSMGSTPEPTGGVGVFTSTPDFLQQEWCSMN